MGVEKEDPVTRLLGADPALGPQGCKPGIATVNLRPNGVLIAAGTPPDVSPKTPAGRNHGPPVSQASERRLLGFLVMEQSANTAAFIATDDYEGLSHQPREAGSATHPHG